MGKLAGTRVAELKAKYTFLHDTLIRYATYLVKEVGTSSIVFIFLLVMGPILCCIPLKSGSFGKNLSSSTLRSDTRNYRERVRK